MPKHKILVLGEHSHGGDGPGRDRAMNIACGVVIAVVIVAMIVATIVYFVVQNNNPNDPGPDFGAPGPGMGAKKVPPRVQASNQGGLLPSAGAGAQDRFGQVPMGSAPQTSGPIFPKLTAQDERELAKSHNANMVKNYPSGYRNAVLVDPKYNMIGNTKPIYGNADFFPYRGKEDEMIIKLQMEQAKKYDQPFNMSDDQYRWKNEGIRAEFT